MKDFETFEAFINFLEKRRYYVNNKKVLREIVKELKIRYYWTEQCLETAKEETQNF